MSNPIFVNIQEPVPSRNKRPKVSKTLFRPKSTYATNVITLCDVKMPCLCCDGAHCLENCSHFKKKTHREKLNFLRKKGICFGCLCKGHMSKDCKNRLACNICNQAHLNVLHINFKVKGHASRSAEQPQKHIRKVSSNACGHAGAGNSKCALSILPVEVKSVKSYKIIQTYALLDLGSSATFYTKKLVQKLCLEGKQTTVLLRTMAHEKTHKKCVSIRFRSQ